MIIVLVGDPGQGKTLALTVWTYYMKLAGYEIHTNYNISGYKNHKIDNTIDLKKLSDKDKWFALDEFWLDIDSRMSYANKLLSEIFMQHRKRKMVMGMTAQFHSLFDLRVRNITNLLCLPEIIENNLGYPIAVKIYYTSNKKYIRLYKDVNDLEMFKKFPSMLLPTVFNGFNIIENYDTHELVDKLSNEEDNLIAELLETFAGYEGKKTDLASKLEFEYDITASKASRIAAYIIGQNKA